ncbi:unnamed protein product [Trichobilharzia regenti]|nr:unnamed protein product [Trichobilharzia regenti]
MRPLLETPTVCPGQVGVFYFGDETNGHVFSYNFSLNDSRARGNQSRYSILIVSWNKIYLLNLWSFLSNRSPKNLSDGILGPAETSVPGITASLVYRDMQAMLPPPPPPPHQGIKYRSKYQ